MEPDLLLNILVIGGLLLASLAVMALVAWAIAAVFKIRSSRRGPDEASEQSITVANGLFELDQR